MPVMRQGEWWEARATDGVWLKWDPVTATWVEQNGPPPPPSPSDPVHAHPAQTDAIEPYRSIRRVATALLVMFGAGLALDLIATWSDTVEIALLDRIEAGRDVSLDEVDASDSRQAMIGIGQTVLFFAEMIVFLVWFRRAYRNLPSLGARGLRFKPGWAVGSWFVPILNWWRPLQITNDIWRASDPSLGTEPNTGWRDRQVTALLGLWWVAWLIANQIGQLLFRRSFGAETVKDFQTAARTTLAADISSAIATALVIAVVWRITRRQLERAQKLEAAGTLAQVQPGAPEQIQR